VAIKYFLDRRRPAWDAGRRVRTLASAIDRRGGPFFVTEST